MPWNNFFPSIEDMIYQDCVPSHCVFCKKEQQEMAGSFSTGLKQRVKPFLLSTVEEGKRRSFSCELKLLQTEEKNLNKERKKRTTFCSFLRKQQGDAAGMLYFFLNSPNNRKVDKKALKSRYFGSPARACQVREGIHLKKGDFSSCNCN